MDRYELGEYYNNIIKYNKHYPKTKKRINRLRPNYTDTAHILDKGKKYIVIKNESIDRNSKLLYKEMVYIPKKKYLERIIRLLLSEIRDDKEEENIYSCFVSFNLVSGDQFNATTFKVPVLNTKSKSNRKYNKILNRAMQDILERLPRYQNGEDKDIYCDNIYINVSIHCFRSISNWNLTVNEEFIKYKDFVLFTAPNKNINCVRQCVEFLGGKYNKSKDFIDQIPQREVYYYIPKLNDIKFIKCMDDLISNFQEEYYSTDCKNIARIIKFKGHMGVICKIKEDKFRSKIQKKKRIKSINETNELEIFVDIESFTKDNEQIPYLLCWIDENNNLRNEIGENCINSFIDNILNIKNDLILYAWFGSGYDYQYILVKLKEKSEITKEKYIIKNSMINYAEFEINGYKITLKDPYLFLLTSLDKASKAFNVTNKGAFPHNIIKNWDDLNKIPREWPFYKKKVVENENNIQYEEYIYKTIFNDKTILENAIEYCNTDVLAMKEVWQKFNKLVSTNLNVDITSSTFTLSQLSMKLMESLFPANVKLYVPNKEEYTFIKNALFGGRVIAKNGIYEQDILYADVVSLYPSAMKLLEHGYGKPEKVLHIDWNKHGIYNVKLIHKMNKEPNNYLEFIPRRIEGRLKWNWFKEHEGTYHTYDLMIAKEEGYDIECYEGIEYPKKGYIFDNFINKLFILKEKHSNCKCEEQPCPIRMIAKIALNGGGYGKFVQKPIDREVYIVEKDIVASIYEELKTNNEDKIISGKNLINKPKFYNLDGDKYDKMVIETEKDPIYSTQNGISILSGSRYRLYKLCKNFPNIKIIYSDTDSIFVLKNTVDVNEFKNKCGTNLGDLDSTLENSKTGIIHKMIVGGPKMYAYCYDDQIKMYCKGVPKNMLNFSQFKLLSENKELYYNFEILRRKLTTVKTLDLKKKIRQT